MAEATILGGCSGEGGLSGGRERNDSRDAIVLCVYVYVSVYELSEVQLAVEREEEQAARACRMKKN